MLLLLLCMACNVLLAVIFKGFSRYGINNMNAIIVNYAWCAIVPGIFLGESAVPVDLLYRPWFFYALVLAAMFIVGFNLMALSFQKAGVSLTIIIQKMSLVMPALFAIIMFKETAGILKLSGILLALSAIILVNWPDKKNGGLNWRSHIVLLPISVFLLSGLIEMLLYFVEIRGITGDENVQFTASSFFMAGILGLTLTTYHYFAKGTGGFSLRDVGGGIILGIPNYFTIYLLLLLLSQGWEGSILFPINSIGILIGTTLVGILAYRERLSTLGWIGLVIAFCAILMINT